MPRCGITGSRSMLVLTCRSFCLATWYAERRTRLAGRRTTRSVPIAADRGETMTIRFRGGFRAGASCCALLLLVGWAVPPALGQSTKAPQQPLYLPDPTPRQRDPHTEFSDNAYERARQEQAAITAKQKSRAQVLADSREILLLADQLRSHTAHPDGSPPAPLDRMAAQKIEKLAKNVKTTMQLQ